ncbi:TM2 domain-containing membrane protein YozV [Microvirga flocculans]|uniref:TM2 domain-containing membrane protein YozV n=1 Tax=Microvirga flocculans TaxID=217168 RepID=A0A7W6N901_9HYPH|nr:TM2 domain-containing protein [Microvirga flocculans]MBB4041237.1 TM2 domain-containing membrane protein YozV [Microvirga flocculans]
MTLTTEQHLLIETRVTNEGPSIVVAYLFWFFLGIFSAHRFYLGRPGTAILQILSFFVLIGFVWLFIDLFLIPGMVRSKQQELRQRLAYQLSGQSGLVPA